MPPTLLLFRVDNYALRLAKLAELEQRIATTARFFPSPANEQRLARWPATQAKLKETSCSAA
jgi:hypothetical protein